ncbi:hypothetical protein LIER_40072 [Lithospermum erythrorhizon]|uniref:GAG-pre-integrase domain-containing protein n=1 Tax=Lithospermum erythrorhizon TaxID=34254 RepID=A0AAV3QP66_LITER
MLIPMSHDSAWDFWLALERTLASDYLTRSLQLHAALHDLKQNDLSVSAYLSKDKVLYTDMEASYGGRGGKYFNSRGRGRGFAQPTQRFTRSGSNFQAWPNYSGSTPRFQACQLCQSNDHIAPQCPRFVNVEVHLITTTSIHRFQRSPSNIWYPDTGATYHVTPDLAALQSFDEYACTLVTEQDKPTQRIILTGLASNGHYSFQPAAYSASASSKVWHHRLGHPHSRVLQQVISRHRLGVFSKFDCFSCPLGKACRQSFSASPNKSSRVLNLIFTDVWGRAPKLSFDGMRASLSHYLTTQTHPYASASIPPCPIDQVVSTPAITPTLVNSTSFSHSRQPLHTHKLPHNHNSSRSSPMLTRSPSFTPNSTELPPVSSSSSVLSPLAQSPVHPTPPIHIPYHTQSTTNSLKPTKKFDPSTLTISSQILLEPTFYTQANRCPLWRAAMQDEINAMICTNTDGKYYGYMWIFKLKRYAQGQVMRRRARLVAKCNHQQEGVDYFDTFSPVVKHSTIRILLTLVVTYSWPIKQLDIQNAF